MLKETLVKLKDAGILGAKEALDMYNKGDAKTINDVATIIGSVNGPGVSEKFDALIRKVHQYGLSRKEDVRLLIQVYSNVFSESDAHDAYTATLKGALLNDWRIQYTHVTLRWSILSTTIFGIIYAFLKIMMMAEETTPMTMKLNPPHIAYFAFLNLGYVIFYHLFAFGIASSVLLTILSIIRLIIVAIKKKSKLNVKYTVSWILVNIACFTLLVILSIAGFTFPYLLLLLSAILSSMIGGICCSLDCECRLNGTQVNSILSMYALRLIPKSTMKSLKNLFKEPK